MIEDHTIDPERDAPPSRGRGRPLEMSPARLLARIRRLARRPEGLFRIHRTHGALYARARRLFGSWSGAVRAAGVDYEVVVRQARARSLAERARTGRRRG